MQTNLETGNAKRELLTRFHLVLQHASEVSFSCLVYWWCYLQKKTKAILNERAQSKETVVEPVMMDLRIVPSPNHHLLPDGLDGSDTACDMAAIDSDTALRLDVLHLLDIHSQVFHGGRHVPSKV